MLRLQPDGNWWYEHIFEEAKEDGEQHGFSIHDIDFSGFYSQGDGASWTGYVDMVRWLEKNKADDPRAHILIALMEEDWVERKVEIPRSSSRYSHSNTMRMGYWGRSVSVYDHMNHLATGIFAGISIGHLLEAIPESDFQDLADEALESARSYADEIYKRLEKEYEWLCSEEQIAELCDANEYLFREDGSFV
jgi:hypothetical protein